MEKSSQKIQPLLASAPMSVIRSSIECPSGMPKFAKATNFILGQKAPTQKDSPVPSKLLVYCSDGTSGSRRSHTLARSLTISKKWSLARFTPRRAFYTEYPDPRREEWQSKILPALKKFPMAALIRLSGLSRPTLTRALAGRSRPRPRNRELLKSILRKLDML